MSWLAFVILALACFRVVRLIVEDDITEDLRRVTVKRWFTEGSKPADLFECPWCVSIYVAGIEAAIYFAWHGVWMLALPFAWSAITGLIAKNLDD